MRRLSRRAAGGTGVARMSGTRFMSPTAAPATTSVAQHHRLQDLVTELHGQPRAPHRRARGDLHSRVGEGQSRSFRRVRRHRRGRRPQRRRLRPAVHHPVDLEAVHVRDGARGARARTRCSRCVGVEPSGDAFNSIWLHGGTNRPFNPMVNTGAITVTALLHRALRRSGVRAHLSIASARWPAAGCRSTRPSTSRSGEPATATARSPTCC